MQRSNSGLFNSVQTQDLLEDEPNAIEFNLKNALGDFAILPDELIVTILEFIEYEDLQPISVASTYFWNTCNKRFFDTLYAHALRFNDWQTTELEKLNHDVKSFKNRHQITLFSFAHRSWDQNAQHYRQLAFGLFALIFAITWQLYYYLYRIMRPVNPYFFLVECFAGIYCVHSGSNAIGKVWYRMARQNAAYLQSSMTERHRDELQQLTNAHKIFLPSLDQLIVGTTSVAQLLDFLQQAFTTTQNLSDAFSHYLQSKKTSRQKFLNAQDFEYLGATNPTLLAYAKNAATLWHANNHKAALIAIAEIKENNQEEVEHSFSQTLN